MGEGGGRMEGLSANADRAREDRLIFLMNQHGEALLRMCTVYLRDAAMA